MDPQHSPSQATLCWHGENSTSSASSEQMRALAGVRHAGHGQVGHGVWRSVYSPETAAAGARATT